MQKTGSVRIQKNRNGGKPRVCVNCGRIGTRRVTYEDVWGKLIVVLCDECSRREYEDLKLQSTLDFPGIA